MTTTDAAPSGRRTFLAGLAAVVAAALPPAPRPAGAQCVAVLRDGTFEAQRTASVGGAWVAEGSAGIDRAGRLSHRGLKNAWARNTRGWNGVRQQVRLFAGQRYVLRGYVRTSSNVRHGYFGFRDARQRPVSEVRIASLPGYTELRVDFTPSSTGPYNVFAGLWAPNGDAWMQVDDVRVDYPCNDTPAEPGTEGGAAAGAS